MARDTDQPRAQAHRKPRTIITIPHCGITTLIPILFLITIITPFLFMMAWSSAPKLTHLEYSTVTGYFEHDNPDTESHGYDFFHMPPYFGLIDREYDSDAEFDPHHEKAIWERFQHHVETLNERADSNTEYKMLYLGRHGEGYHNVAEAFYGTQAWDCYWSAKDGNGTLTWADARLTEYGREYQARLRAHTFWRILSEFDPPFPLPQSYYSSPLLRCLETANLTWSDLPLNPAFPFKPIIKEMLREVMGVHTCDRRSSKSEIQKVFPNFVFEEGFEEHDKLWKPDLRETEEAMLVRARSAMDDIFNEDRNTFISISSHSGMIAVLLKFIGHREFELGTGQMMPVLVKVERVDGPLPPSPETPWEKVDLCTEPPVMPLPN